MSTEIRSREENGFMVFEKDKLNDLEIKFFNPEYFSKIGFPDAEIKIVNKSNGQDGNSTDLPDPNTSVDSNERVNGEVIDQSDANAETLQENAEGDVAEQPQENAEGDATEQPDANAETPQENVEGDVAEQPDANAETPQENVEGDKADDNIENKIKGGYYKNVEGLTLPFKYFVYFVQSKTPNGEPTDSTVSPPRSEGETIFTFDTFYDRIKNVFRGNNNTSVEQSQTNPISDQNSASDSNMWVVKIPITTDADTSQMNEYKKEELKLNQALREFKMEQSNHLIIKGEVFNVGTRFIKIAQTVEEGQPILETDKTKLLGTKMAKYERLTSST